MLKLSRLHIDAIRKSELRFRLARVLNDRACLIKPLNVLPSQIDSLHDACLDALSNETPVLEEFTAEQDLGPYPILLRGVAGVYFVQAADHDDLGVFTKLEDARVKLDFEYGNF